MVHARERDWSQHRLLPAIVYAGFIALILMVAGLGLMPGRHTAAAHMTVVAAACAPDAPVFRCRCDVEFRGRVARGVSVVSDAPLAPGAVVRLLYDPDDPTDVTQEEHVRAGGVAAFTVGAVVGAVNMAVVVRKFVKGAGDAVEAIV